MKHWVLSVEIDFSPWTCHQRHIQLSTAVSVKWLFFLMLLILFLFYIKSKNKLKAWKVIKRHSCTPLLYTVFVTFCSGIASRAIVYFASSIPAFAGLRILLCLKKSFHASWESSLLNAQISKLFLALLLQSTLLP